MDQSPFNARWQAKLLQTFGPAAARVLRIWGGAKEWFGGVFGKNRGKSRSERKSSRQNVNLGQALKTLVHVQGLQMLVDGFFNASIVCCCSKKCTVYEM